MGKRHEPHVNGDEPTTRTSDPRRRILLGADVLMAVAAATAVTVLCLEYGFYDPPVGRGILHAIGVGVVATFVLNRVLHLLLAADRRAFFRENWFDFALMLVAGAAAIAAGSFGVFHLEVLSAVALYVVITQLYILVALVAHTVSLNLKLTEVGIHPMWILIGSFVVAILLGAGLLLLPRAASEDQPVEFLDALFTSTSAACVTGLAVRDTGAGFTRFGQLVILGLIQLGGLGIMIFGTLFALLAGHGLSVQESLLAGQVLSESTLGRIARMVKFVILFTLAIEAVAALAMLPMWQEHVALYTSQPSLRSSVFHSVFHSVSAFCNAGFALQADNLERASLRGSYGVWGVIGPLIFLGGLGFPVLYDLVRLGWARLTALARGATAGKAFPLTLHSKLVLTVSVILLVGGAAGLLIVETVSNPGQTYGAALHFDNNLPAAAAGPELARLPIGERARESVFQSITARTAGFNTVSMDALSEGGKLWMCLLMIVGGSPASTAGGLKTTTLAVLLLTVWCALRRRERTEGFRRSIGEAFLRKAVTVAALYLVLVAVVTLLLCVALSDVRVNGRPPTFMQVFFEACSACGTVGLSCGVTGSLTAFAKVVIVLAMFAGRVGPLTLLLAMTLRLRAARYAYPTEEVILG